MRRLAELRRGHGIAALQHHRQRRQHLRTIRKAVVGRAGAGRSRDPGGVAATGEPRPEFIVVTCPGREPLVGNATGRARMEHRAAARDRVARRIRAGRRAKHAVGTPREQNRVAARVFRPRQIDRRSARRLGKQEGRIRGIGRADAKGHGGTGDAEIAEMGTGSRAIPPSCRGRVGIGKRVGVARGRVARVVRIALVTVVDIALDAPASVGLHQAAFVVLVGRAELIVVAARFVDMPEADARAGQTRIETGAMPIFHDEVFRGRRVSVFRIEVKRILAGPQGRGTRRVMGEHGERRGPAGLILQIGADLHRLGEEAASAHQAPVPRPHRLKAVIVQVGESAHHVPDLVAEGTDAGRAAEVTELVGGNMHPVAKRHRDFERRRLPP
ncbi:MAG: hypothetical protein BWX86_02441 [Verrucomicrobia bacterium ADurb.Bin122]|nr:MAG: hypothetical protein BWX86_02441 [Verrucomicrobia bacterium ADurb.Bin122]